MSPKKTFLPLASDQRFSFSTSLPVLIEHINLGNHLSHNALINLLQEARVRYLKNLGFQENQMILSELNVKYFSESFHGDVLTIQIAIVKSGPIKVEFVYRVLKESSQQLVAEAHTTLAFYDYIHKRPLKSPPKLSAEVL